MQGLLGPETVARQIQWVTTDRMSQPPKVNPDLIRSPRKRHRFKN